MKAPAPLAATTGQGVAVSGVSISDAWASGVAGTMALNVYDKTGSIRIAGHTYGPGGGKVAGGMITGTEAQLNADLAAMTYIAGKSAGADTLTIDVWNQAGVEATETIPVAVAAPSCQDLALAAPAAATTIAGAVIPLSGLAIDDAWAAATPGTMALTLSVGSGTLILAGKSYGPGFAEITGTEAQLNADLATASYQASNRTGSDSVTLGVWNQAGVNVSDTIAVTVAAPAGAGAPRHNAAIAAAQASFSSMASAALFTATAANHAIFIGGSNDTIQATGGTEAVSATAGHDTIVTGAGNDRIAIGGNGNLVNAGAGVNTIVDNGGGNTIVLPAAGGGLDVLNKAVLTNGDLFDLRPILNAVGWNKSAATLAHYLSTSVSGGSAVLTVASGQTSHAVAQFTGSGAVPLATILQHAIL